MMPKNKDEYWKNPIFRVKCLIWFLALFALFIAFVVIPGCKLYAEQQESGPEGLWIPAPWPPDLVPHPHLPKQKPPPDQMPPKTK